MKLVIYIIPFKPFIIINRNIVRKETLIFSYKISMTLRKKKYRKLVKGKKMNILKKKIKMNLMKIMM